MKGIEFQTLNVYNIIHPCGYYHIVFMYVSICLGHENIQNNVKLAILSRLQQRYEVNDCATK